MAINLWKLIWRGMLILVALVAIEQSFLHFYLDHAAIHDDAAFTTYLASLKSTPPRLGQSYPWECGYSRISYIYKFKMCVGDGASAEPDLPRQYYLRIQKPAGYLTLVPWNEPDRILYDGVDVFGLTDSLDFKLDLR